MINLEIPPRLKGMIHLASEVAESMLRPISRKYDTHEHTYPVELDVFGKILQGMEDGGQGVGASHISKKEENDAGEKCVKNGKNMLAVLTLFEMAWGDLGLTLTIPGQGLGNSAIAAVASAEQKARFSGKWAAMAITEPGAGSDSSNISTTAVLDGETWVLNGEKIFVTCGERADLTVVWATTDKSKGKVGIKSFVVEKGTPGFSVERVEDKMGIRASDTVSLILRDCRIPKNNLLGKPEVKEDQGFAGAMQTFDNTRPVVAAMAIGVAKASLDLTKDFFAREGIEPDYRGSVWDQGAIEAEIIRMEAELEASRLLTLKAAWMADNGQPNSKEASMAKAKAGRVGTKISLRCVELCGAIGYGETELLEKWARDIKITDIFEGTQQIQQLIIARRLLRKSSKELH
ncbi:MAG: acyl-CoA dehydrogenase family protein [Myxococcota bacterium]|nr:acyl-CoA dehydrogenase family protein [Myxococcota bacterium]